MTKVSVVIPTFNKKNTILDAIKSVINQHIRDYEIIVVDDGSTDNTKELLNNIINNHPIRYFYQENHGPGAARNSGIKVANGEYICFLDADDLLLKDSLEKRINFLVKNPDIAAVFSDFSLFYNDNLKSESNLKNSNFLDLLTGSIESKCNDEIILNQRFLVDYFRRKMPIVTNAIMIRKSVIEKVGFFREDIKYAEDRDLWWRIIKYYKRIGYIDEPLSFYRRDNSTLCKDIIPLYTGTINFLNGVLNDIRNGIAPNCNKLEMCELKKVIRNRLSTDFLELGREYFRRFNSEKSRFCFIRSIKYNCFNLNAYTFVAFTYLPTFFLKKLRGMKQSIS